MLTGLVITTTAVYKCNADIHEPQLYTKETMCSDFKDGAAQVSYERHAVFGTEVVYGATPALRNDLYCRSIWECTVQ
eukprot:1790102-Rhodomonas_salina.4